MERGKHVRRLLPAIDVVSCGKDIEEARKNLLEVIEIQLEETAL